MSYYEGNIYVHGHMIWTGTEPHVPFHERNEKRSFVHRNDGR
jgi:hypothetical protein